MAGVSPAPPVENRRYLLGISRPVREVVGGPLGGGWPQGSGISDAVGGEGGREGGRVYAGSAARRPLE